MARRSLPRILPRKHSNGYQLSTVCPDSESAATDSPFWICSSASPMSKFLPLFNSTAQAKLMPCHSPNAMRSQSLCRKRCCLWYREPSSMTRDAESKPRRFKRHPRSPVDSVTQHFEWRRISEYAQEYRPVSLFYADPLDQERFLIKRVDYPNEFVFAYSDVLPYFQGFHDTASLLLIPTELVGCNLFVADAVLRLKIVFLQPTLAGIADSEQVG